MYIMYFSQILVCIWSFKLYFYKCWPRDVAREQFHSPPSMQSGGAKRGKEELTNFGVSSIFSPVYCPLLH